MRETSTGRVRGPLEGSNLGFGISGGKGVIWVCMPFVDAKNGVNSTHLVGRRRGDRWTTARRRCGAYARRYGGNSSEVFLAGFSRGAIACNYIGLHDDEIASLWRGFFCHSHYDGVDRWDYAESDRESAARRIARLGNRPQFISHENDVSATQNYLKEVFPGGNFTFLALPFPNHTDAWVLRDIPERKIIREWFRNVLKQ